MGYISWVLDGNFYLATRKIFKAAKKCLLKRMSEEEAEVGVLDDMSMDIYRDIADLHGQGLHTSYCPVSGAICSFHFYCLSLVHWHPESFDEVPLNDHDL